ncbi:MAG: DUF1788 domain-containing protein [Terrisporobacter sp.]|mgnify:FL=1|uniref:DUF1788 domain-containing protein n=1 Tax=Terrisporobacter sp. TaxID=1965305 RepID=UPI0025DACCBD|nr:DUF1788 domain-containing protein [uncultured Terrisporobacter sp.]
MRDIHERLSKIKETITNSSFKEGKGLGNEIGFYIFDYEPKYEMLVREYVYNLKRQIKKENYNVHIKEFDLYDVMLELLDQKGYLQKNFEMEKKKGSRHVFHATEKTLRLTSDKDNKIVNYISQNTEDDDIVFLTGVGKVWPIIRSHTVLNNLHRVLDHVPVVLFFPGTYDGGSLRLFNEVKDDNYYRAFQLVDKY